MQQQINAVLEAASAVKAATQMVSTQADLPACQQFIEALDTLEASAENLRRTPSMPSLKALWERRVTVETILWPSVYFDAQHNGEALAELVDELDELGTSGVPREVTERCCELIRNGGFNGLIARVSMYRSETSRYTGVIAAEDFEAMAARAADWGSSVLKNYAQPGSNVVLISEYAAQKAA